MTPKRKRVPNNRVESNRCQASCLRSGRVIGGSFRVCHGALSAAVAHPKRSAASSIMRVCEHTQHLGSGVTGESDATGRSHGSRLAQFRAPLGESARCVAEAGAWPRLRPRHSSRPFESGLAMAARRRLRTAMLSCPIQPPNHRVETNRRPASRSRSGRGNLASGTAFGRSLSAAVAHPER